MQSCRPLVKSTLSLSLSACRDILAKKFDTNAYDSPLPSPEVYAPTFSHLRFLLTHPQSFTHFPKLYSFFSAQAS